MVLSLFTQFVKRTRSVGQLLVPAARSSVLCLGWEGSRSLGLMLSSAAARSDVFFSPKGASEIIYSSCFIFLSIIPIYWAHLAWVINQSWGYLLAPARVTLDLISSLEAAKSPWHPKRRISVFFGNFCMFQFCDKLRLLGMAKGLAAWQETRQ